MRAPAPPLLETLDESVELVASVAAPWVGVLWLTAVPLRLAQAHLAARLLELGNEAGRYGDYLRQLTLLVSLFFLLSLLGRAALVRALTLRLSGMPVRGWSALRLPPASFASYAYAALFFEVAFYATCLTGIALPFTVVAAALAAATSPQHERPGLLAPLRVVLRQAGRGLSLLALLAVFAVAHLLASLNLFLLFRVGLWAAGGVGGLELARWEALLRLSNPRFVTVLLAGGLLLVEPFWLAAVTHHVHKTRALTSGADLRLWFERLRGEGA